jgi:glycosyltransferase involved in cell wall biosynthesis
VNLKKVSIIVPVYNPGELIHNCIRTLRWQTYDNLEIILVDDGSKDGTDKVLDQYAEEDSRLLVIHQKNGGISVAQNTGLDAATGDYITFVDNDDLAHPQLIEKLVYALESTDAGLSKCRWGHIGVSEIDKTLSTMEHDPQPHGKVTLIDNPLKEYQTVFSKIARKILKDGEARYFNEANWCKMYKAELFEGVRFPVGRLAQDLYVSCQIYNKDPRVADIDNHLYFWLQNQGSVTHNKISFRNHHDAYDAGIIYFNTAIGKGILPIRSYRLLIDGVRDEKKTAHTPDENLIASKDKAIFHELASTLTFAQKIKAKSMILIRVLEGFVYDIMVHNRR